MAEPDYKLISSVLLGQLRMIANETTFDSLEEVREFARQCELVPTLLPYQMIALKDLYDGRRRKSEHHPADYRPTGETLATTESGELRD